MVKWNYLFAMFFHFRIQFRTVCIVLSGHIRVSLDVCWFPLRSVLLDDTEGRLANLWVICLSDTVSQISLSHKSGGQATELCRCKECSSNWSRPECPLVGCLFAFFPLTMFCGVNPFVLWKCGYVLNIIFLKLAHLSSLTEEYTGSG